MANPIILLIKEATKKPSLLKAVAKYTGRQILRRTGVFGTYGTFKRFIGKNYSKLTLAKKITGSIIKKNVLRALGPANYMVDILKKKGGLKYALKQFGWQRMTPMAIKKVWYLYQNYQYTYGGKNPILQQSKKEIWKKLRIRNSKHTYTWKLDQIQGIMDAEVPKKVKRELLDDWFYFRVHSKSGNFSVRVYKWHPLTGELVAYVRSGGNKQTYGPYFAYGVPIDWIKKSVKTTTYGKKIYWVYYHTNN